MRIKISGTSGEPTVVESQGAFAACSGTRVTFAVAASNEGSHNANNSRLNIALKKHRNRGSATVAAAAAAGNQEWRQGLRQVSHCYLESQWDQWDHKGKSHGWDHQQNEDVYCSCDCCCYCCCTRLVVANSVQSLFAAAASAEDFEAQGIHPASHQSWTLESPRGHT